MSERARERGGQWPRVKLMQSQSQPLYADAGAGEVPSWPHLHARRLRGARGERKSQREAPSREGSRPRGEGELLPSLSARATHRIERALSALASGKCECRAATTEELCGRRCDTAVNATLRGGGAAGAASRRRGSEHLRATSEAHQKARMDSMACNRYVFDFAGAAAAASRLTHPSITGVLSRRRRLQL